MDWQQRAIDAEKRADELELEVEDLTDKLGLANNDLDELKRENERLSDILDRVHIAMDETKRLRF